MKLNGVIEADQMQWSTNVRWLPILMYHRVMDELNQPDPYNLNISTSQFESQMRHLSEKGYKSIHLDDIFQVKDKNASPWNKPVIITFDDGYIDTYTKAFPILEKYGLTATVLLVSSHIGGSNTWDHGEVPLTSLLGQSEIIEMAGKGIGFGSHSATHKPLTELSYVEARSEIVDSKHALEDLLGNPVRTFGYPYGRSTPVLREMTQEAGYIAACGIEDRQNTLFNLSRVDAVTCADNWMLWRMKISGTHYKLRQSNGLRRLKSFLTKSG